MCNTGGVCNTISGNYDSSKGDFRLQNVRAGDTRFVDFTKVPALIDSFCEVLNEKLALALSDYDALVTSFDAHYNFVTIHPFRDGNGRVSRLIMNYVQGCFGLPLCNVFKEDKGEYYKALLDTRDKGDLEIFRNFMFGQYSKMLSIEIRKSLEIKCDIDSKEQTKERKNNKGLDI